PAPAAVGACLPPPPYFVAAMGVAPRTSPTAFGALWHLLLISWSISESTRWPPRLPSGRSGIFSLFRGAYRSRTDDLPDCRRGALASSPYFVEHIGDEPMTSPDAVGALEHPHLKLLVHIGVEPFNSPSDDVSLRHLFR